MRGACIDIGSNTTRLLVADVRAGRVTPVHEARVYTRIGAAMADGMIPAPTCAEVIETVAAQLARARALGAQWVRAVATAAVRRALNGGPLIDRLAARTGLAIELLAPEREAQLAFRGAAGMWRGPGCGPPAPLGVLDVGGGSSEVVIGDPAGPVSWWVSLPVGSGTLSAVAMAADPPRPAEIAAARTAVARACSRVRFDGPPPACVLAVGGSATSLARFAGRRLDAPAFADALGVLCGTPATAVAARWGIDPVRVRLLPAGLIILEALAQRLGTVVEVGCGGLREGVLLDGPRR